MVSAASVIIIVVFTLIATAGVLFLTLFWLKTIQQFKQKRFASLKKEDHSVVDTIYERMAEDSEVTEQYEYTRKKLVGG